MPLLQYVYFEIGRESEENPNRLKKQFCLHVLKMIQRNDFNEYGRWK